MLRKEVLLLIFLYSFHNIRADEKSEYLYNINSKRPINFVSDKFLSISIDPAVLLAGINLSENSLRIAKLVRPAYIRLAGPSTEFVKYLDEENFSLIDSTSVTVTPSMWFGINEWLSLTQLMPIFGINDAETVKEVWNPKSVLALFEISDKLNVTCFWQLGFDASNKTELRYKQDLSLLQQVLSAFPEKTDTWKIIGSDLSSISGERSENIVDDLEGIVNAVMWEPKGITEESFLKDDFVTKVWPKPASNIAVWTTIPKSTEPVTFLSVLAYARQVGDAAKSGYGVVFRQPRMHELVAETPVYWFTLLHKKLMGSTVLDTRTTVYRPGSLVYAHCTRSQNSYVRGGALTILVLNNNVENYKVKIKLGAIPPEKAMEVQEYILTSSQLNSTEILLNDVLLTMDLLQDIDPFIPKIRRAKTTAHVLITLPPNSVGFFVLPGARMQVCIDNEKERDLLLEEIENDQNIPLPEELDFMLGSRSAFARNSLLDEITQHLKEEMIADEKFYKSVSIKSRKHEEMKEESKSTVEEKMKDKGRKFLIDRAKQKTFRDFEKRRDVLKKFLLERAKNRKSNTKTEQELKPNVIKEESSGNSKELKSGKKSLKETVSLTSQRDSIFTDEELNKLIMEASNKFTKNKFKRDINKQMLELMGDLDSSFENINADKKTSTPTKIHARKPRDINGRRSELREKLEEAKQRITDRRSERLQNVQSKKDTLSSKLRMKGYRGGQRFRRDINMDLLKVKAEGSKKNTKYPQKTENDKKAVKKLAEKEATLRKPGQTSDELFDEMEFFDPEEEDKKEESKQIEVFAELADPDYDETYEMIDTIQPKKNGLFDKKPKVDPFGTEHMSFDSDKGKKKKGKGRKMSKSEDNLQFLTSSEEFTDIEEDLPCIHEFYGKGLVPVDRQWEKVIYELGEFSSDERKQRKGKQMKKESMELPEEDLLEDDLLRRKRSVEENLSGGASHEISSVGEFLYPSESENFATRQSSNQFSSLGEFLYPSDFETNKLNEDAGDFDDYSDHLLRETKEINFKDKTRTEDNLLATQEMVKTKPYASMNFDNYLYKNDINQDTEVPHSLGSAYRAIPEDILEFSLFTDNTLNNKQNITENSTTSNENSNFTKKIETTSFGEIYDNTLTNESQHQQKFKVTEDELEDNVENMTTIRANNDDMTLSEDNFGSILLQPRMIDGDGYINTVSTTETQAETEKVSMQTRMMDEHGDTEGMKNSNSDITKSQGKNGNVLVQSRLLNTDDEYEQERKFSKNLHKKTLDGLKKSSSDFLYKIPMPDLLHSHNFTEDLKAYQHDLKEHFKEFMEIIEMDKKKYEEEKKRNKMRLQQIQKKQQELVSAEEDILGQQLQDNRHDFMEQLKLLRKKFELRKSENNAKVLKSLHETHKPELDQHNLQRINTLEKNAKNDNIRNKRAALFNTKTFTTYHPQTPDLKPWTAADILSLRREQFLGSDQPALPNDNHLFRNILDEERWYNKRKRSIDSDIDYTINDINNLETDVPNKFRFQKKSLGKFKPIKTIEESTHQTFENSIVKESDSINKIQTIPNEKQVLTNSDRTSRIMNLKKSPKRNESHIQKIAPTEETRSFEKLIRNITGFLSDLGKQIGSYINRIAYS